VAGAAVCGADVRRYSEEIERAQRTGYTHVCLHRVGPAQEGFVDFCAREIPPALADHVARRPPRARAQTKRSPVTTTARRSAR
jgi:hypothetical protein